MEKELDNIESEDTLFESSNTKDENREVQLTEEIEEVIVEKEIVAAPSSAGAVIVPKAAQAKATKKIIQGKVVSNKPDKTVIIKVERQVSHPIYKKYYKKTKKFMAHDENNDCNVGDIIRIRECRPLSARKNWELVEIVERAK